MAENKNNQGNKEKRGEKIAEHRSANKSTFSRINPTNNNTPPKKKR